MIIVVSNNFYSGNIQYNIHAQVDKIKLTNPIYEHKVDLRKFEYFKMV